jgi:hypothetical protein
MVGGPPDRSDPQKPPESGGSGWSESPERAEPPYAPPSSGGPIPPPAGGTGWLRPRRVGEIVDDAIRIYREHWRIFLPISALVMVPAAFLQTAFDAQFSGGAGNPPGLFAAFSAGIVGSIVLFVGTSLLTGAVARVTSELCLGRSVSPGGAIRFALARLGSLVGVALLSGLAVFIGALLLFFPLFIALAAYAFASIAVVVEGAGATQAMGRSWRLSKGHRWKILGTQLLMVLIAGVAGLIIRFVVGGLMIAVGGGAEPVTSFLDSALANVITAPLTTIALTLLYFDVRIKKEAFDLTIMARELGPPAV